MIGKQVLSKLTILVIACLGIGKNFPLLANTTPSPTTIAPGTIATDANGFEMVYVPAGEFEMGTTEQDFKRLCEDVFKGSSKECSDLIYYTKDIQNFQKRTIKVASFWLDRYEVTIEQYQPCTLNLYGCRPIRTGPNPKLDNDPHKPQFGVTWYDAMFFCNNRLGRLPTEAEWEYAARGPKNLIFPWGNTYNKAYVSSSDGTYPVGSVPQNKSWVGAYDMAGNIAEWVEDRAFSATQSQLAGGSSDTTRIIRGGSWGNQNPFILTFYRVDAPPNDPDSTVGFRCLRTSHP